ncbi:hypothetical protein BDQ17DRAFT_1331054 [Cyathus striatus]|nr:hypothetical protein BDQ17DRAFT_1331054 [Cyathus striatus]
MGAPSCQDEFQILEYRQTVSDMNIWRAPPPPPNLQKLSKASRCPQKPMDSYLTVWRRQTKILAGSHLINGVQNNLRTMPTKRVMRYQSNKRFFTISEAQSPKNVLLFNHGLSPYPKRHRQLVKYYNACTAADLQTSK